MSLILKCLFFPQLLSSSPPPYWQKICLRDGVVLKHSSWLIPGASNTSNMNIKIIFSFKNDINFEKVLLGFGQNYFFH